jgi:hypothetical protein
MRLPPWDRGWLSRRGLILTNPFKGGIQQTASKKSIKTVSLINSRRIFTTTMKLVKKLLKQAFTGKITIELTPLNS